MKAIAKIDRCRAMIAALTCLMLAGTGSALAVLQKHTGKAVAGVTVVTENQDTFINSTSYQNLPGATATITVPADKVQLVIAEFTAESTCVSTFHPHFCSVRIVADGTEMSPAAFEAPVEFAFDGSNADDFREAHAMQRSILLGPGRHTLQIQVAVSASDDGLFLDDWSLSVTQYNNGK